MVTLVLRNLLRRPARTMLTAAGVALGVGLIVALLSISTGVQRTADELIHVGHADFGLFQGDVSDFSRSLLPESLAAKVAQTPGVRAVARLKLFASDGANSFFVFGLDPREFVWRRLVVVEGRAPGQNEALVGDRMHLRVGEMLQVTRARSFRVAGIYHSGDAFEDAGAVVPLHVAERLATRPAEITTVAVAVQPSRSTKQVAQAVERRFPGTVAVTEPSQAIRVDTSSRLIVDTGWIISLLALIVGEALGIALVALGVGLGLGVLAAHLFSDHTSTSGLVRPDFTAGVFAWGLAFALGVALIGAAYPTWRAVRLTPIEALRRE